MDSPTSDAFKLPNMVMCGDHSSFTKTDLNIKESKPVEKDKDTFKDKSPTCYTKGYCGNTSTGMERTASELALRAPAERRRVRSLEAVQRPELALSAPHNKALVKAAMGSFRWPPYLLCVWVVVLVLTHLLHCLVTMLERTLPNFKKACQYFRDWTEQSWKTDTELNQRVYPAALASLTGALYVLYGALYALHCVAVWAIEPLCPDDQPTEIGIKVTDYIEQVASHSNSSIHH